MPWICPTFQRPHRLAELAASWDRCEHGKELWVRIWERDPFKQQYFDIEWPEGWILYESPAEWCGEALHEFWLHHPNEKFYGFIGDDIVLRTPGGLGILEREADDWFIAWPNDCVQRFKLATHFCVGGKLTNTLGWWVYPPLRHHYLDMPVHHIAINTGLGRYCPNVVFEHRHFLTRREELRDATYDKIYQGANNPYGTPEDKRALPIWEKYLKERLLEDCNKVLRAVHEEFEDLQAWRDEDVEMWNGQVVCSGG